MPNIDPDKVVVADATDPKNTVDGHGKPRAPRPTRYLCNTGEVRILARAAVQSGDSVEAKHLYDLLGEEPESKLEIHTKKPVSRGVFYAFFGAVAVIAVNEAIGAWRHRSGKNWATIFQGYKAPLMIGLGPVDRVALNDMVARGAAQNRLRSVPPMTGT
jgi:hypothetical protein